jgi:hypothetical protein
MTFFLSDVNKGLCLIMEQQRARADERINQLADGYCAFITLMMIVDADGSWRRRDGLIC